MGNLLNFPDNRFYTPFAVIKIGICTDAAIGALHGATTAGYNNHAAALLAAGALVLAAALLLFVRERRDGKPWLVVAVIIVLQSIAFETLGRSGWWDGVMNGYAAVPIYVPALSGLLIGGAAVAAGWKLKGTAQPY